MCLVHKHLAQLQPFFSFCFMNSLMPLALPRVGIGKKGRPYKHRHLLLNSLNNFLPQAIDRLDSNGNLIKGLWNSLSTVLGAGSWLTMRIRINFGLHFTLQISPVPQIIKALFALSRIVTLNLTTLAFEPSEGGIFAASDTCFGYGIKKLHMPLALPSAGVGEKNYMKPFKINSEI